MPEEKKSHRTMPYQAKTLQLLIENARDYAIVMLDTEGRIALWNTGAENVLGWQEAEIVGQPAAIFFTPEDRATDAPERELRTAREQGRAEDERWHVRKDGSRFWGSGLVFPVVDGELRGYLKIFRDLTERRRSEEAVRVERERLQATLDAAEVGTWLVDAATNRVIGDAALCGLFGLTEQEGAAATPETYLNRIHPEDAPGVAAALQLSMTTGQKFDVTYRVLLPDGALRWLDVRGQAAFNAEDRFVHLYGAGMDVTAREQTQEALRLSEEKYRLLFNSVDQGFCHCEIIVDGEGKPTDYRFLEVNPAFENMTGLVDTAGRTAYELVPGLEDWWAQTYGRVALRGEPARFQYGSEAMGRFFDVYAAPTGQGRFVLLFTDITARRKAEQERERSIAEIEGLNVRLARAMQETHHRVKNNLQVIAALVEMQADELGNVSAVQRIKQHVRSLATIHDLLTQQAKADANTSVVNANEVLQRLIPMLQATTGDRHIKADVDDVMLPVQKATSLALLVSECVSNAIKHAKGEVEITLDVEGNAVRLEVCDDGSGFPPDFDSRRSAHTGLELIDSTAHWDLRGEVHYENREQGGGRVVVTFPLDTQNADRNG